MLNVSIQGNGFPILCLHGHPGSAECMTVFTNHLASKNWQTITPDLRGYGASKSSAPFTMNQHIEDLEQLIDDLHLEKLLILGWSLGGILALELALKLPEKVSGLILLGTAAHPWGNHPPITWGDYFYTAIAGLLNKFLPGQMWHINNFAKKSLFRYLIQQHTPTPYQFLATAGVNAYLQTSNHATQALNQALRQGYNRLAEVKEIDCPALVLAGQGDRHITANASYQTARQIHQSEWLCYPDTAHLFPWEIPDMVLRDIDHWLSKYTDVFSYLPNPDKP